MFTCVFNCLLSFKHFLNMFCASFGMDIFHLSILQCKQYYLTFAFWVFTQLSIILLHSINANFC